MDSKTLEELKKAFMANHDRAIEQIQKDIATERKTERQQEIMRELAKSVNGLDVVRQMQGIMAKLSAFSGYQDGEAEERRKGLSVVVCRPIVTAKDVRKGFYVVAGGCGRGREKSASKRRNNFKLKVNWRSAEQIQAVNDLIRWGIL